MKQCGFSFLELIIALGLFSAGLLGILQLQFLAQLQLQQAMYTHRALLQAYHLSTQLILFPMQSVEREWAAALAHLLPSGEGRLEADQITVTWMSGGNTQQVQLKRGI